MDEFWWNLPLLRRLSPLWRGVAVIGLFDLLLSLALSFSLRRYVEDPQPAFLSNLASVGATLFVAFVIENSAAVLWSTRHMPDDEALSGEALGFGFCGFLGVALALALSDHAVNRDLSWLEEIAFGWAMVSLFMLGLIVAAFPLMHYERNRRRARSKTDKST